MKVYYDAGGGFTVDNLTITEGDCLPEILIYEVPDEYTRDENWQPVANKATYEIQSIKELDKIIMGLVKMRNNWNKLLT